MNQVVQEVKKKMVHRTAKYYKTIDQFEQIEVF